MDKLECPLCKGSLSGETLFCRDHLTKVEGIFQYTLCNDCGSYIQNPIPTFEYLMNCYSMQNLGYKTPFNTNNNSSSFYNFLIHGPEILLKIIFRKFSPILNTVDLIPSIPPPARILEIGCSHGSRLLNLKNQGYQVKGIDLIQESVDHALKLGLDVDCASVESSTFPDKSFDIIIMSMALEHLRDPFITISQIAKWVNDNGEILISVPCADGYEFNRFKECTYEIHPPYHIFIPSVRGLHSLLNPFFIINCLAFQEFHRSYVASTEFKRVMKNDNSLRGRVTRKILHYEMTKSLIRIILMIYIHLGGKTSRLSLRCKKRKESEK